MFEAMRLTTLYVGHYVKLFYARGARVLVIEVGYMHRSKLIVRQHAWAFSCRARYCFTYGTNSVCLSVCPLCQNERTHRHFLTLWQSIILFFF